MAGRQVPIDSLAYVDDVSPEEKALADQLIREEMRSFVPRNYLESLPRPNVSSTDQLAAEYERCKRGIRLRALDYKRYELPAPIGPARSDVAKWKEAAANVHAQLEHQSVRSLNLEVISECTKKAWLNNNKYLGLVPNYYERANVAAKRKIDELNTERKTDQVAAKVKMDMLNTEYEELCTKNFELQMECELTELALRKKIRKKQ